MAQKIFQLFSRPLDYYLFTLTTRPPALFVPLSARLFKAFYYPRKGNTVPRRLNKWRVQFVRQRGKDFAERISHFGNLRLKVDSEAGSLNEISRVIMSNAIINPSAESTSLALGTILACQHHDSILFKRVVKSDNTHVWVKDVSSKLAFELGEGTKKRLVYFPDGSPCGSAKRLKVHTYEGRQYVYEREGGCFDRNYDYYVAKSQDDYSIVV